jgi:hypothetical protein
MGQKQAILKDFSPYLLYAYGIYPMVFLMNMESRGINPLNDDVLEEAFQAAWDSISVSKS